jgi:hypothetical protein
VICIVIRQRCDLKSQEQGQEHGHPEASDLSRRDSSRLCDWPTDSEASGVAGW